MKKQISSPQFFFRPLCASAVCLLIGAGFSAAIADSTPSSCALLQPADLSSLLGGKVTATNNAGACTWTASGSKKKLIAGKARKIAGVSVDMALAGARKHAPGKVADEAGLGDKAFSRQESFGAGFMMAKQGRLLQLQYWTGTTGTAKDVDALRPVAKRAFAAL